LLVFAHLSGGGLVLVEIGGITLSRPAQKKPHPASIR
jgi:hypothetical protein